MRAQCERRKPTRRYAWAVSIAAMTLFVCLLSAPAQAQAADILVSAGDDLQLAVDNAVELSRSAGHVRIVINNGTYGGVQIPADADIQLINASGVPTLVTIDGAAVPAIRIHTNPDTVIPDRGFIGGTGARVQVEGLTLKSDTDVVFMTGFGDTLSYVYSPLFNRCYITGGLTGVWVEGQAQPELINCSISGNARDGVHVVYDNASTPFNALDTQHTWAYADLLFCSIIQNGDRGVFVETGTNAQVRNTLVYRNGDDVAAGDGGLVWEDAAMFINPNEGPVEPPPAGFSVTITGSNLFNGAPSDSRVFFGPPSWDPNRDGIIETEWTLTGGGTDASGVQTLTGNIPPSYNSAPDTVDVYLQRISDGFTTVVRDGFTYINNAGVTPLITLVNPNNGPVEGGNWIEIRGRDFQYDAQVWFDLDKSGVYVPATDAMAPTVQWLSASRLYVEVPDSGSVAPLDVSVFARNTDELGGFVDSNTGVDYAYNTMADATCKQPLVIQAAPNYIREVAGVSQPGAREIDIHGRNFYWDATIMQGPIVQVGGIICPYDTVSVQPPDINGNVLTTVKGVKVPVAEFGTGGIYDVTVTNPCGLFHTLPGAFTYYADGVPRIESIGVCWRPANFRLYGDGCDEQDFRLLGDGYDTELNLLALDPVNPANNQVMDADGDFMVSPDEVAGQHVKHSQRQIEFTFPPRPDANSATSVEFNPTMAAPSVVTFEVSNGQASDGRPSTALPSAVLNRDFFWTSNPPIDPLLDQALYFQFVGAAGYGDSTVCGNSAPDRIDDIDTYPNSGPDGNTIPDFFESPVWSNTTPDVFEDIEVTNNTGVDMITMWVRNWISTAIFDIFVNDVKVPDASIITDPATDPVDPLVTPVTKVTFPAPLQLPGTYGPVDISLEMPAGATLNGVVYNTHAETLYYVAENIYSYHNNERPYVRAVTPTLVPEDGRSTVSILGSNFMGPAAPLNRFTRMTLVWPNGEEIDVWPNVTGARYQINSFNEIEFSVNLILLGSDTTRFPRNVPVDIRLAQWDDLAGAYMQDTGGNPLIYTARNAITFASLALQPTVSIVRDVDPATNATLVPERRDGPVEGGTNIEIIGYNLVPGNPANDGVSGDGDDYWLPDVLIGNVPAGQVRRDASYSGPGERLLAVTPPAPFGRPGTCEVVVLTEQIDGFGNRPVYEGRAPSDQSFTYFMDGGPFIGRIEPNNVPAESTDITYLSVLGANFDDIVGVNFFIDVNGDTQYNTGIDTQLYLDYYAVSPQNLIVEAPFVTEPPFNLDPASATDFPGGEAELLMTVQNIVSSSDPSLVSNAVPIKFYLNGANSPIEPRVPLLKFNDVYLNAKDYINAQPGKASISMDPLLDPGLGTGSGVQPMGVGFAPVPPSTPGFDPTWWLGRILASSPLVDKAASIDRLPYTRFDLDLDDRPLSPIDPEATQGTGQTDKVKYDIGADEVTQDTIGAREWYYCLVTPSVNELNPEPIGLGDFNVVIGLSGVAAGENVTFCYVPQGGDPNAAADRIYFDLVQDPADGLYRYDGTGNVPTVIDTELEDRMGNPGEPEFGDLIADGHAAIYIEIDDGVNAPYLIGLDVLTPDNGGGPANSEWAIVGQALSGRHFLIDTTPPEIDYDAFPGSQIHATDLVTGNVGPYAALGLPGAYGAMLPVYPAGTPGAATYLPAAPIIGTQPPLASYDYGYLMRNKDINNPPYSQPTQVFYNIGGQFPFAYVGPFAGANGAAYPYAPINISVAAPFLDKHLEDAGGALILGDDYWVIGAGLDVRQPSGFTNGLTGTRLQFSELATDSEVAWQFASGTMAPLATTVNFAETATPSGLYTGWFSPLYDDDQLSAAWTFNDESLVPFTLGSGIYNPATDLHMAVQFLPRDRAGNVLPPVDYPDPLHIWNLVRAQTRIRPNQEGMAVAYPRFTWELERQNVPTLIAPSGAEPTADPQYTYAVWTSNLYDGVYTPLFGGNWLTNMAPTLGWSAGATGITYKEFSTNSGLFNDWVLIVVLGSDEAGNIEQWPNTGIIDFSNAAVHEWAKRQPNWLRFNFDPDAGAGVDTTLSPTLWHNETVPAPNALIDNGETSFGASKTIPTPDDYNNYRVEGKFTMGATVAPDVAETLLADPNNKLMVLWTLSVEGGGSGSESGDGDLSNGPSVSVIAPLDLVSTSPVLNYPDPAGVDVLGDSRIGMANIEPWDLWPVTYVFRAQAYIDLNSNGAWDPSEPIDPTPAEFRFTVVPPGYDGMRPDAQQPIRIYEDR